jgi:hypothetical protein
MPGAKDDVARVFYLRHTPSVQEFQEVAVLIWSISDMGRLFTYNAPRAVAVRGASSQVALARWLVHELGTVDPQRSVSAD